jgi:hypothetical protein
VERWEGEPVSLRSDEGKEGVNVTDVDGLAVPPGVVLAAEAFAKGVDETE